jgi:hypothetical protein
LENYGRGRKEKLFLNYLFVYYKEKNRKGLRKLDYDVTNPRNEDG